MIDGWQLRKLLELRLPVAQHAVNFRACPGEDLGMLEQFVERERQQPAGRLLTGDEQPYQFTAHVLDGQFRAGLGICAVEQQIEEVWDVRSGKEVLKIECDDVVSSVAFSPDGLTVAASTPRGAHIWEVASGRRISHFSVPDKENWFHALAFAPEGSVLATAMTSRSALFWGLDRNKQAKKLTPMELRSAWDGLASDDAAKGYGAICALVNAPADAVPFLEVWLDPVPQEGAQKIRDLFERLDDGDVRVMKKLSWLGPQVTPVLQEAEKSALLSVRQGAAELRRRLDSFAIMDPEILRAVRAIVALERIGTAESRRLLETIGEGEADARPTLAAKAALERLAKRKAAR